MILLGYLILWSRPCCCWNKSKSILACPKYKKCFWNIFVTIRILFHLIIGLISIFCGGNNTNTCWNLLIKYGSMKHIDYEWQERDEKRQSNDKVIRHRIFWKYNNLNVLRFVLYENYKGIVILRLFNQITWLHIIANFVIWLLYW